MSKAVIASFRPSFAPGGGTKSPTEENPMPVSTLYNPQEMPEDAFRQSFVVRRGLLEDLLREIRKAAPGERFQHTILQGQRGQGKTTLLRKLSLCVRDDPELSGWLIPILFREEEYSVVALCRLWERTADYLAEHLGFENLPEQFEAALVSPHYEKDCFDILARALEQEDKHLLLLIDNFGEMLDKFGKADQQRFREILLTSRRIRIVAGSAATLEQHYDHGKPFFNFFRLRTLEGLNAQEARELMLSLGDEDQKKRMAEILETRPGKLEALRRLTAGVPRTLILLFEIFLDDDGSAMEDLEVLLDRVTPLYKHRLDDLPTQQQAIVYEIAMGWDALSVKEIAVKARLPSKQISAQLQYLEKNHIVRSIATSTKNKLYQLEERFFNIWCLMRLGRSGDKRRAVWLVRFLEIWCDQEELAERVKVHIRLLQNGKLAPDHGWLLTQAYAEVLRNLALQDELLKVANSTLEKDKAMSLPESDLQLLKRASEALKNNDLKGATKHLKNITHTDYFDKSGLISSLCDVDDGFGDFEREFVKSMSGENASIIFKSTIFSLKKKVGLHLPLFNQLAAANLLSDSQSHLLLSNLFLLHDEYSSSFAQINKALSHLNLELVGHRSALIYTICVLAVKNQTAFALKLFEDEEYAALNLKERLKPLYYAILQEVGPSRADNALRMGPELEETVAEIRREIERMRLDYRTDAIDAAAEPVPVDSHP
jgi:hypothetical protein